MFKKGFSQRKGKPLRVKVVSAKKPLSTKQVKAVSKIVAKKVNNKIETKTAQYINVGATNLQSETLITNDLVSNMAIAQGTGDGQRIGDYINVKKFKIKLAMQNTLGAQDVFYRIAIVRSKLSSITLANLFRTTGTAGQTILQSYDTDDCWITYQKTIKVKAQGTVASAFPQTVLKSMSIPVKSFGYKGKIHYDGASSTLDKNYYTYLVILPYAYGQAIATTVGTYNYGFTAHYQDA